MDFDFSNISGALTPEQAHQALAMGEQGDTGAKPEDGGAPATTTATADTGAAGGDHQNQDQGNGAQAIPEDQMTADNTVILARDGKHTIDFNRFDKTRQQRDEFKALAESRQSEIEDLQAQAQARADAGQAPTKTDNIVATATAAMEAGADADLFGDFSEGALKAGIQKLVAQQVQERIMQAKQQQDAATAHFDAIYGAYPNADSIVQSAEFQAWVDAHPSGVRSAYWDLFDSKTGGTAAQIVEVFDAFTAATQKPTTAAATTKDAAKAALANAKTDPPSSLSSIPGGRAEGGSALDATNGMSGPEMMAATAHMSPDQIDAWLNRQT
jgi:hypothetical protein